MNIIDQRMSQYVDTGTGKIVVIQSKDEKIDDKFVRKDIFDKLKKDKGTVREQVKIV